MSELPGTAAVGIDAVEWEEQGEGNLTLRVSGRWRRRPRGTSGKPTLILESGGRRHRFSALPEPPGLGGAPPGAWRLSFTLPGTLAPDLGRTWLQFGTVIVPLPVAMPTADELRELREPSARPEPEREPRADPPYLQAVPDLNEARAQAPPEADRDVGGDLDFDDIGERVAALERDLRHARAGRDELAASLQERDRSRRIAEQRAHAESALRQDLARQLSANLREMERVREAMGELAAAEERIRRLEAELELTRRRAAEAEQIAAAARAARERAERERDEAQANPPAAEAAPALVDPPAGEAAPAAPAPEAAPAAPATTPAAPATTPAAPAPALAAGDPAEPERLALERRLALARPAEDRWRPDEPAVRATVAPARVIPVAPAAAPELPLPTVPPRPPAPAQAGPVVPDLLRRELDTRARAEAALRSRLVDAESTLAARIVLERRTKHALDELRAELAGLRDALAAERAAREETEARLADARARVDTVRSELAVAETRAEAAAGQIAAARTEAAQAHARIDGALAHAAQAENRAVQADARAQEREAQLSALAARLSAAEAKAGEAETRRREAEARVGEAESERAAADAFAQTTAAARTAADSRAETAARRARAAAAEALRLREELAAREGERAALAGQVDALQARIAQLEQDLSGQRVLSRDAYDAIGDLRQTLELVQARAAEATETPSESDRPPAGTAEAPPEAGVVDADRLSDALTRLRQTVPAPENAQAGDDLPPPPGPELPGAPAVPGAEVAQAGGSLERLLHRRSLEVPFRRLVRADPAAAGRLLIELLPLQAAVHPRAVTYDLVLGEGGGCVCVTSPHGDPLIEVRAHPRPREEVDLRVIGDPARIARRLTAGRLRRIFGVGLARCRGRRPALAALQALIATPLDLTELERGGAHLEPASVFGLVAAMIEPAWTRGERFVLAHEQDGLSTAYLTVADGRSPRATQIAPAERVTTTLTGTGDQLLCLLAGRSVPGLAVRGDEGPLLAVRRWLRQAGHV